MVALDVPRKNENIVHAATKWVQTSSRYFKLMFLFANFKTDIRETKDFICGGIILFFAYLLIE